MEQVSNDTDSVTLLSGIRDRELWYAEGGSYDEDGQPDWRFPIFVDWKTTAGGVEYASLFPAVCPTAQLALKLKALFEVYDKLHRSNHWLVRAEVVPAILKKAPGITPERYYRCDGKAQKPISYTKETMPNGRQPKHLRNNFGGDRGLILRIAEECGLQSSVVKIVMDGLNKVAARVLIDDHMVMDLGFAKLIAVPFRANWKEIVCFKLRKLGLLGVLKEGGTNLESENDSAGLPEILCSPNNIALRREKERKFAQKGYHDMTRIDYSIEVVTSKRFEEEVAKVECRQRSIGHTAYVSYYEKTVERIHDSILEILRAYRKKIGYPFARVCDSSRSGGLRFVETLGIRARAHGRNLRDLPVHIVPPARGFSAAAEESQQELVCEAPAQVPKLPAFSKAEGAQRPALDDLREREESRALEELSDRDRRAGGVPVQDACQSASAREPVLLEPAIGRGPPWVDIIGD